MTRVLAVLLLFIGTAVWAQDTASTGAQQSAPVTPRVETELSADTTVVGQPLVLRVKVLVPTWMPSPPAFPSMEAPNLMVRLPERATNPISERVGGETWSGVSRAYRLYPMIAGQFSLPAQSVALTYADPGGGAEPLTIQAPIEAVTFVAILPAGAEALDPPILANGLSLEQTLDGGDGTLGQGDAVTRTLTATITGTSALFIPPLIPEVSAQAVQSYPRDPVVKDTDVRGVVSGSRTDTTTYVAQYGGSVDLPEISIEWFNVETGKVETATVPGVTLSVDAPPPPPDAPKINKRQIAILTGSVLLLLLGLWVLRRYALPPLTAYLAGRRARWNASEAFAAKRVEQAIDRKDLNGVLNALALWTSRCPGSEGTALEPALAGIGAVRFGGSIGGSGDWAALAAAFRAERTRRTGGDTDTHDLPPLNPS